MAKKRRKKHSPSLHMMDMRKRGEVTQKQAADMLGIAAATLAKWRSASIGPKFRQVHARLIAYKEAEISRWIEANNYA